MTTKVTPQFAPRMRGSIVRFQIVVTVACFHNPRICGELDRLLRVSVSVAFVLCRCPLIRQSVTPRQAAGLGVEGESRVTSQLSTVTDHGAFPTAATPR